MLLFLVSQIGDPCGSSQPMVITNSDSGEILSPNHPGEYPSDADCQWHIEVNAGQLVQLTFIEFDMEDG